MQGNIIVTSEYPEFTTVIEKASKDYNANCIVIESASIRDGVNQVKDIIAREPGRVWVIVSGGVTLKILHRELPAVPKVNISPTEYDILLGIDQARILRRKTGIISAYPDKIEAIENICSALDFQVKTYAYTCWDEMEAQIEAAKQDEVQVIVGICERIAAYVRQAGLHYIAVAPSEFTVKDAIKDARFVVANQLRDKLNEVQAKVIATHTHDGIIAIDEEQKISIFNPIATKIFDLSEQEVVGKSLNELDFNKDLLTVFQDPEKKTGYLLKTPHGEAVVNKVPISHQSLKGILVTLKEINSNQEKHKQGEPFNKGMYAKYCFDDIIYAGNKMAELIKKAGKYANTSSTVLIQGESGTGKELLAQSIHNADKKRRNKPFIAINCAVLDGNLLRSELFGYTDGAFTGAVKGGKPGLFELANGGTLFLDEIGKMKLSLQNSLLRVLQEKEVRRIGGDYAIPIDVKVISASNENLPVLVNDGTFREDLFFRLNVLKLNLPSLRERKEDIPILIDTFLRKFSEKYSKPIKHLPQYAVKRIMSLNWPGNVRQLEHLLERAILLADKESEVGEIIMELVDEEFFSPSSSDNVEALKDNKIAVQISTLADMNTEIVHRMRRKGKLTNSELALKLGISRPTLIKILKRPYRKA